MVVVLLNAELINKALAEDSAIPTPMARSPEKILNLLCFSTFQWQDLPRPSTIITIIKVEDYDILNF